MDLVDLTNTDASSDSSDSSDREDLPPAVVAIPTRSERFVRVRAFVSLF